VDERLCWDNPMAPLPWERPFKEVRLQFELEAGDSPALQGGEISVHRKVPISSFCRVVHLVGDALGGLVGGLGLCSDCSQEPGCLETLSWGDGVEGPALYFSPRGFSPDRGCVSVRSLPASNGYGSSAGRVQARWEVVSDGTVRFQLGVVILGLLLSCNSVAFSQSTTVHALVGMVLLCGVLSLTVAWRVLKELRKVTSQNATLGGTLTVLLYAMPVFARDLIVWTAVTYRPTIPSILSYRDPFWDLPVGTIGTVTIVAVLAATMLFGASQSVAYFASAPDLEGDVGFTIAADGRRVDHLPPAPLQQRGLEWALWALGVGLVFRGAASAELAVALLGAALLRDRVWHFVEQRMMLAAATSPESFRQLVPRDVFRRAGRVHTDEEVDALRQYAREHATLLSKMRDGESELRLRRFVDGGAHFQEPLDLDNLDLEGRRSCCLL
jgi:hypothetical protein